MKRTSTRRREWENSNDKRTRRQGRGEEEDKGRRDEETKKIKRRRDGETRTSRRREEGTITRRQGPEDEDEQTRPKTSKRGINPTRQCRNGRARAGDGTWYQENPSNLTCHQERYGSRKN